MGAVRKFKQEKIKKKARRIALKVVERVIERRTSTQAVLVVCNRCSKSAGSASALQSWIEGRIDTDQSLKGRVAVRRVGCLGPCPKKKKLAVALGGERERDWKKAMVLDPKKDREDLLTFVSERIRV